MKSHMMQGLLLGTLSLATGSAGAVNYYLAAKAFDKTLPDGSSVPMWGYVEDTGGTCYNAANDAARLGCVAALPTPEIPGPMLEIENAAGDPVSLLRIFLSNGLPEPTSIVITGQEMPFSGVNNGPTFVRPNGTTRIGSRNAANLRVRSFGREAAENGGRRVYVWNNSRANPFTKPGTFIYHSGTHPQKQVYMGLYGAVTKDAVAADPGAGTPAEAYPGVAYDNEITLFYSEIDPELNTAVAGGTHDTSIHYHARWFLINGEPYSTDCTDVAPADGVDDASGYPCANMAQTLDIDAGVAKSPTLLRFLSTAGETHVPILQGLHMTIHAEDGVPYGWEDTATSMSGPAPREQYSAMLPPLKTKDAIIEPQLEGRYALYDGNGYMTNPTSPDDFDHGDPVGGMLRFLAVGANGGNLPPIATDDPDVTTVESRTITIDVLANDIDPEGQPLRIDSFTTATSGTVSCNTATPGETCVYTAPVFTEGDDVHTFTYMISDGVNVSTTAATVTVTVVANVAPVAFNDPDTTTDVLTPVVVNVLANDTDENGDVLAIASIDTTGTVGTVACENSTGDCTYTPDGVFTGPDTFTYVATDGYLDSDAVTVTVTVSAAPDNSPPVATDDTYNIGEAGILNGNVVTDDTGNGPDGDADGDPLTAMLVGPVPANAATFTFDPDGSFSYQSTPDFNGLESFMYEVNDGNGLTDQATVNINVTAQNDIPVANPDTFILMSMGTWSVPADGVLANDTDPDGNPLTAAIDVDPNRGTVTLAADGSFDYDPEPGDDSVGTVTTFTYVANDGTADSAPATVTLDRKLSVREAICERRVNGNCDWRIEGLKATGANQRVEAWLLGAYPGTGFCDAAQLSAGNCLRSVATADGVWNINRDNRTFNSGLGPMDFRVNGDPDAQIRNYTGAVEN